VISAYVGFTADQFFLLSTDSTYSGIPGGKGGTIFFRLRNVFLAFVLRTNWCTTICITCLILRKIVQFLRKIECNEFVYNEFVSNLVQINLIQFEFSNCIRSVCTKTNTNLLHENSLHSISHKIGHVIQIVVHQFVHKTSAKKKSV
jgi:hypothetical protein